MIRNLFWFMVVMASTVRAQEEQPLPAPWQNTLDRLVASASTNNKPILIEFTTDWCTYCKLMEQRTLPLPEVKNAMKAFEFDVLNYDITGPLARKFGIKGIPAYVVLSPQGDLVSTITGFREGKPFVDWLISSREKAIEQEKDQAAFAIARAEASKLLASEDPAQQARGVILLLDQLNLKNPGEQTFAKEQLLATAKANPEVLIPFLKHPKLMQRILVANALRAEQVEGVDMDVWK